MPIPIFNFAALPTEVPRIDPTLLAQGYQQGLGAFYAPKMMDADLEKEKLANALSQVQLKYMPQKQEADIANTSAQNDLLGQQSKYYGTNINSEIAARNAQAELAKQQAKYLPFNTYVDAMKANNAVSRFGQAYNLSKMLQNMPSAARSQWLSQHPQEYSDMVNTLANKTLQQQEGNGVPGLSQAIQAYFPQFTKLPQSNANANLLIDNAPGPFTTTPEQAAQIGQASQIAANNSLTTAATRRQLEGAQQVSGIMNDPQFQAKALNAAQYAGARGKGKQFAAALSQKNPQAYEDYLSFMNQDMVLLSNRIKTLDQMGATDKQREDLEGLYTKTMNSLTSNPQQFIAQLNMLGESLDRVAQSVQKSARPLGGANMLGTYQPIGQQSNPQSGGGAVKRWNPATRRFE